MRETNRKEKGYFSRCVCTGPFQCQLQVSRDNNVVLFLVQGGYLSHGKFYNQPAFRQKGEVRDPFLHQLYLKCLQLNIINRRKQHVLGWHVLIPFTGFLNFFEIVLAGHRHSPSCACKPNKTIADSEFQTNILKERGKNNKKTSLLSFAQCFFLVFFFFLYMKLVY